MALQSDLFVHGVRSSGIVLLSWEGRSKVGQGAALVEFALSARS